MTETSKPFRLREGKKHFGAKPGDTVYLTEAQAKNFADKFDAVDGPSRPMVWPKRFAEVNEGVPQDFGAQTATASMVDADGKQVPPGEVYENSTGVSLGATPAKVALQPAIVQPGAVAPEQAAPAPKPEKAAAPAK